MPGRPVRAIRESPRLIVDAFADAVGADPRTVTPQVCSAAGTAKPFDLGVLPLPGAGDPAGRGLRPPESSAFSRRKLWPFPDGLANGSRAIVCAHRRYGRDAPGAAVPH